MIKGLRWTAAAQDTMFSKLTVVMAIVLIALNGMAGPARQPEHGRPAPSLTLFSPPAPEQLVRRASSREAASTGGSRLWNTSLKDRILHTHSSNLKLHSILQQRMSKT